MPRHVDLLESRVRILFSGIDSVLLLRSEVSIPYAEIQSVEVGLPDVPPVWDWGVGLSWPFSDRRQGRFRTEGGRVFLDVRHRSRAVVLHLKPGSEFALVAWDEVSPEEVVERIRERLPA